MKMYLQKNVQKHVSWALSLTIDLRLNCREWVTTAELSAVSVVSQQSAVCCPSPPPFTAHSHNHPFIHPHWYNTTSDLLVCGLDNFLESSSSDWFTITPHLIVILQISLVFAFTDLVCKLNLKLKFKIYCFNLNFLFIHS